MKHYAKILLIIFVVILGGIIALQFVPGLEAWLHEITGWN